MDVEKMRQIGQDILAIPQRFNMNQWYGRITESQHVFETGHDEDSRPPCGTVACFAGEWGLRFGGVAIDRPSDYASGGVHIDDACRSDLGLANDNLFYVGSWPRRLQEQLRARPGTPEYARYFVETVLEDYIATNGWEGEADADEGH